MKEVPAFIKKQLNQEMKDKLLNNFNKEDVNFYYEVIRDRNERIAMKKLKKVRQLQKQGVDIELIDVL
jgi:hypothetical protein